MIRTARVIAMIGAMGVSCASADVITFESGFTDQQAVTSVVTATNVVTFGVGPGAVATGPAYIAKVGNPETAFSQDDIPADLTISGEYFLTDEFNGPSARLNYFMDFAIPVLDLSLNLYDYRRDGGPQLGDIATLTAYSDLARTIVVGTSTYVIPSPNPVDGNIALLSILSPTDVIRSASITFSRGDVGTGIDNIAFRTVPEPSSLLLGVMGLAGCVAGARLRGIQLRRGSERTH